MDPVILVSYSERMQQGVLSEPDDQTLLEALAARWRGHTRTIAGLEQFFLT